MKNPFSLDGPLFVFLSKLGDMMILNIMFLITCIPIVTVGAGLTALYATAGTCICRGKGYVFQTYWREFTAHFKRSTIFYLINVVFVGFLYVDMQCARTMLAKGTVEILFEGFLVFMAFITILIMTCAYPYLSVSNVSIRETIKKSIWIAVIQLPTTIMMALLNLGPWVYVFMTGKIYMPMIGAYTLIGFALTATIEGFFLNATFKKIGFIQEN